MFGMAKSQALCVISTLVALTFPCSFVVAQLDKDCSSMLQTRIDPGFSIEDVLPVQEGAGSEHEESDDQENDDEPSSVSVFAQVDTKCRRWCFDRDKPWTKKCNWKNCNGCEPCLARVPLVTSAPVTSSPYVPGEPGAPWSESEMLVVRAKIHAMISNGLVLIDELGLPKHVEYATSVPDAAKLLRLGFHDCMKYTDGTGGCDGCLEWDGMGNRFPRDTLGTGQYPADVGDDGHNNGLGYTVQVLEAIYTDAGFPVRATALPQSLKQSGKSRADLWAFAALVAVEYSADHNNRVCRDSARFADSQCHPRDGEADCEVSLPRSFAFKTGRRDCIAPSPTLPYAASKQEVHPDPKTNGVGTVSYFRDNFGFNGRESIAIMGAHTLGRMFAIHSLNRYTWKTRSGALFNNGYYRNLALKQDWYYPGDMKTPCKRVGDANGTRPLARWIAKAWGDTVAGGPVQWLQEKLICRPNGQIPDSGSQVDTCRNQDLKWTIIIGRDETALPCEMGFVIDFNVDQHGIPTGCPGFEKFNMEHWGRTPEGRLKNVVYTFSSINDKYGPPQCPRQMYADPGDSPLHEIVEAFASSTSDWLEVFVPTLEKMLENGYDTGELQQASSSGMADFSCPFQESWAHPRFYSCAKQS